MAPIAQSAYFNESRNRLLEMATKKQRNPWFATLHGTVVTILALTSTCVLILFAKAQIEHAFNTADTLSCGCGNRGSDFHRSEDDTLPSDWERLGKPDVTGQILEQIRRNGTTACHDGTTVYARASGLPDQRPVVIPADVPFKFRLQSLDGNRARRCAGGDYYELDFNGEHWKSRPSVKDLEDGSYDVTILVDGTKPGAYNFTARILFGNLHGLDHDVTEWRRDGEVLVEVPFIVKPGGGVVTSGMHRCTPADMASAGSGGGRWTRGEYNKSCVANAADGRWQCLSGQCEAPWCEGDVAALESNGWVYSDKGCGFHIFSKEEAWQCLSGRWLFMWGDSNMLDFLRNLLIFALDYPPPPWANISTWEMNRFVEQPLFVNPRRPDQAVRVSYVFNGHYETMRDWLGLASLENSTYRDKLRHFFNGTFSHPDTFIFNSGLHDGLHFHTTEDFAAAVDQAAQFWADTFRPLTTNGRRLHMLMRTTVAPAGPARWQKSNPQKMEAYNAVILEGFRKKFRNMHVIDAFDATFPFHFDFSHSDGGHYGRPPGIKRWPWYDQPHHYFVEVMLVHMMLNSICSTPSTSPVPNL